jgi:type IV pilus assembly protein PilY1
MAPTTGTVQTGSPLFLAAVKKTCSSGHLWNYTTATSPTDAGTATLPTDPNNPNALNTAGILDYPAIPSAYSVIPTTGTGSFQIATESAATRAQASPILYNLKITQDGLLSLSYSYNGGAAVTVISSQKITDSNGPLPASFRFGFAGSTGGSNNVHEILCFKAAPVVTSASTGTINVYQNPTLHPLQQFFLANYYPSDWTG